jgi:Radical SAM superfamily
MDQVDVVLLAPPYYRVLGSHNNRASLSLTYLSAYLQRAEISHVVYGADHTPAETFWSMRYMFDHYQPFVDAVDGKSSLYGEVVEIVMSFKPSVVVILGGEPLLATKDWANPFIAAHYSRVLRALGMFTVGVGHFFTLDKKAFDGAFDCVLGGEPSPAIVDVVRQRIRGYIHPTPIPLDIAPNLTRLFPSQQRADFVMTSFGCRFSCSFCLVQQFYTELDQRVRFVELETVIEDLSQRPEREIYLTDLTFTYASPRRLRALASAIASAGLNKVFTIDTRVDLVTPASADLLVELGVRRVKIGLEGVTAKQLASLDKHIELVQAERAVTLLRERGIEIVTYLLIGGDGDKADYEATQDYIHRLKPEFAPVAIWAYDLSGDYRYDTQFSPLRLSQWGLDKSIFYRYLDLQGDINPTVGPMIDLPAPGHQD